MSGSSRSRPPSSSRSTPRTDSSSTASWRVADLRHVQQRRAEPAARGACRPSRWRCDPGARGASPALAAHDRAGQLQVRPAGLVEHQAALGVEEPEPIHVTGRGRAGSRRGRRAPRPQRPSQPAARRGRSPPGVATPKLLAAGAAPRVSARRPAARSRGSKRRRGRAAARCELLAPDLRGTSTSRGAARPSSSSSGRSAPSSAARNSPVEASRNASPKPALARRHRCQEVIRAGLEELVVEHHPRGDHPDHLAAHQALPGTASSTWSQTATLSPASTSLPM